MCLAWKQDFGSSIQLGTHRLWPQKGLFEQMQLINVGLRRKDPKLLAVLTFGRKSSRLEEKVGAFHAGDSLLVSFVAFSDFTKLLLRGILQDIIQVFAQGLYTNLELKRHKVPEIF